MKRIVIICAWFLAPDNLIAQWAVYDAAAHSQQIINQAEDIAKYVEMINHQVEQIQQLTEQVNQLQKYNKAFGDPASILNVKGVGGLIQDLRGTPVGQTITALERAADGQAALGYDGNGVYKTIQATFKTPSGQEVKRTVADYKAFEAINRTTGNYTNVTADVLQRRQALKEQIAQTTEKLQSAATASEVQKLTGVLTGLNSALTATDKEIDQATTVALVQDIENRNDIEKQATARLEEQKAEVSETFSNYRQTFRLLSSGRQPQERSK